MTRTEKICLAVTLVALIVAFWLSALVVNEISDCDPALVTQTRDGREYMQFKCTLEGQP